MKMNQTGAQAPRSFGTAMDQQPSKVDAKSPSRGVLWVKRLILNVPEILGATTLALLMIFLVVSVFSRYVMNLGVTWADELSRLLFVWITLIGFALAVNRRANVGVDWFVFQFGPRARQYIYIAQDVIVLVFSIFFTWASYVTVNFAMMQRMPALDITAAWLYGASLAAGVLMIIYSLFNIIQTVHGNHASSVEKLSETQA